MSFYYPQGVMSLRVLFEDFGDKTNPAFKKQYKTQILLKNFRINLNDYTQADTFSCTIDYDDFPFDPRLIRSCGVTLHLDDQERLFKNNNGLNAIPLTESNTVFIGFVDTDKISFNDNDRTVEFEGRDYTALLIDLPYLGPPVSLSEPIDQVVRKLLDFNEGTKTMQVENRVGETLPTLSGLGQSLGDQKGMKNSRRNGSLWDIIQECISDAGLIAYVELDKLVLTKPRKVFNRNKAKCFVYGLNVSKLSFERKLGRLKTFNIRVVSLDVGKKVLVEAKIPLEASEAWSQDLGIKKEEIKVPKTDTEGKPIVDEVAPYFTFRVADIGNKDHLVAVGEKIFEELGRQQIEGELETYEMIVPERDGKDHKHGSGEYKMFDVTKLRIGMPIEIWVDIKDLEQLRLKSTVSAKTEYLRLRGYDAGVANVIAQTMRHADTIFYAKDIEFSLDNENGFSLKIGFVNFIELKTIKGAS